MRVTFCLVIASCVALTLTDDSERRQRRETARFAFGGAPGFAVLGGLAAPLLLMMGLGTFVSLAPSVGNSVQAMFARPPAGAAPAAAPSGGFLRRKTPMQKLKKPEDFWKAMDQYAAIVAKVMKDFEKDDDARRM